MKSITAGMLLIAIISCTVNAMHFCDEKKKVLSTYDGKEIISLPENGRYLVIESQDITDQNKLYLSGWIYQSGIKMVWMSCTWDSAKKSLENRFFQRRSEHDWHVLNLKIMQSIKHPNAAVYKETVSKLNSEKSKFDKEIHIHTVNPMLSSWIQFPGGDCELDDVTNRKSNEGVTSTPSSEIQ